MYRFWNGALAAALIATAVLGSRIGADGAAMPAPTVARSDVAEPAPERFRLVSGDSSCVVVKSVAANDAPAGLSAGRDCDDVMPGLSGVRFWREQADGSVLFGSVAGVTMAAFAQADGAGYESFAPRRPLMALVPED